MDKTDMDLFSFCAQQGYVPYDCQLKGILILGLIQDGKIHVLDVERIVLTILLFPTLNMYSIKKKKQQLKQKRI